MKFSYRGLDFGDGTNIYVDSVVGLRNRSTAINTPDLPRYHGGLVGASYENPRVVLIRMTVISVDVDAAVDDIASAFEPRVDSEDELVFNLGAGERLLFCRPRNGAIPVQRPKWDAGVARIDIELIASDPSIYDNTEESAQAPVFVAPGGIPYPVTYPTPYGAGGTGGGVNVMLGGSWESWPVFQISGQTGTLTNPIIEQVSQGTRLALNAHGGVTMTNGQILVIDTHPARRSIAFTTGASRYGRLSDDSVWAPFQPGMNEVRFRASGTTDNAVLTITARSARI